MSIAALIAAGWIAKAPSAEAEAIDQQVANRTPCRLCGGYCRYIPLTKGDRYKAFAVCNRCGNEEEF